MINRYKLHSWVKSAQFPTSCILLDVAGGRYFALNRVGSDVCRELCEWTDFAVLVSRLSDSYGERSDLVERDVLRFLDEMRSLNLVTVAK